MTKARSNATANAAKGDLTVGTGTNLSGVLSAGNNGEALVLDSSTSTGLRYQGSISAGKNFVINGGFDIWQRGTSFTIVNNNAYTADRFHATATGTMTISRQTTGVPAGSQYCLRMASGATSSVADFFQYIETANVVPLQGKTVTYSIKLRKNAANTSDAIILVQKSATTDAGSGASWSTISSTTIANALLPTGTGVGDWYTASLTLTIPNDGTANSLRVYASTSALIANTAYLELAQSQLEIGSVPTTFSRAGGTIQGELAACQRYYWRTAAQTQRFGLSFVFNATTAYGVVNFPTEMRVSPTVLDTTGTAGNYGVYAGPTTYTNTSVPYFDVATKNYASIAWVNAGTMTAGQAGFMTSISGSPYLGFSAEL